METKAYPEAFVIVNPKRSSPAVKNNDYRNGSTVRNPGRKPKSI